MAKYTLELYAQLEKETGQATGFDPIGMIEIACTQSRLEEFRRIAAFGRYFDVAIEEISPTEVQNLWPMMDSSDVLAGSYGHTLGASVGVGPVENNGDVVTAEYIRSGAFEIDVAGTRYPAKASLRPMYDPKLERVRC